MEDATICVCGWAARIELAKQIGGNPDNQTITRWVPDVPNECADLFGGKPSEWNDIFHGVIGWASADPDIPQRIELAFTIRLDEAVRNFK
jgi:hypothetical protein